MACTYWGAACSPLTRTLTLTLTLPLTLTLTLTLTLALNLTLTPTLSWDQVLSGRGVASAYYLKNGLVPNPNPKP